MLAVPALPERRRKTKQEKLRVPVLIGVALRWTCCPAAPSPITQCASSSSRSPPNWPNFLRSLALPGEVAHWSLTTLRELVRIAPAPSKTALFGVLARRCRRARNAVAEILRRIDRLRQSPAPAT
jgi:hypothetical protein